MPTLRSKNGEPLVPVLQEDAAVGTEEASKKKHVKSAVGTMKQGSISRYVQSAPTFEKCCVDWLIATYQPLSMVEEPSFRKLCSSLNSKAPIIGKDKLGTFFPMNVPSRRVS
jgi:hypothetical protein